jgi:hypothetical protein
MNGHNGRDPSRIPSTPPILTKTGHPTVVYTAISALFEKFAI